jgi:Flp pilus assembly pilin Flp
VIGKRKEHIARHPALASSRASTQDNDPGIRDTNRRISSFLALGSKRGVAAIEYARIAALIAVVIITAVALVERNRALIFNMVAGHSANSPD